MALTNTQYDSIMRIYSDRQLKSRDLLQKRTEEVYQKLPRMAEIDAEVASASVQKALFSLGDPEAVDLDLDAKLSDLSMERKALLAAGGFPESYLEPEYECPTCHDTGFVDNEKCSCFRQMEIRLLYRSSNLGDTLLSDTFDNFQLSYYSDSDKNMRTGMSSRDSAEKALQTSLEFCRSFSRNMREKTPENLCIYGDIGVGKTFLSHCIAGNLLAEGHSVLYTTAYDLFEQLGHYKFHSQPDLQESHDSIFDCELLIIDDLGTEMNNNFVTTELFLVINERILRRKSTLISTNLSLERFRDSFSERTFSRIIESYKLIHMSGNDIRIQKKLGGI